MALQTAIKTIEKAGFTHIKFELEEQLNRNDETITLSDPCTECEEKGFVPILNALGVREGYAECTKCSGTGREGLRKSYNFYSESDCEQFLKDHISKEARDTINFMMFYRDGSVDSELTFTLPVRHVKYVVEVIDAWNKMADLNDGEREVSGAGMHISVLTSGNYPTTNTLDPVKIENFKKEVSKLLPALFVASTSGNFTRTLRYRHPRIDSREKYSAIFTHRDTCLEYRLFETCYQRPEAVYEFVGVIARTLEYYIDPTKKVQSMGTEFPIFGGKGLKGFMESPDQVKIIKKQFTMIKPDGMTIKQFMDHRDIKLTIGDLRKEERDKVRKLRVAFKEHIKAYEKRRSEPLTEYQKDNILYWKREQPGKTDAYYWSIVTGEKAVLEDEQTFIKNNLSTQRPTARVAC